VSSCRIHSTTRFQLALFWSTNPQRLQAKGVGSAGSSVIAHRYVTTRRASTPASPPTSGSSFEAHNAGRCPHGSYRPPASNLRGGTYVELRSSMPVAWNAIGLIMSPTAGTRSDIAVSVYPLCEDE
jgi:hypothetical protein